MDTKTVFGYYLSLFTLFQGLLIYFVLCGVTMGFFISLSIYVNAFSEDFEKIIYEIIVENKTHSISRKQKIDSSAKLTEAILIHTEMLKYL